MFQIGFIGDAITGLYRKTNNQDVQACVLSESESHMCVRNNTEQKVIERRPIGAVVHAKQLHRMTDTNLGKQRGLAGICTPRGTLL